MANDKAAAYSDATHKVPRVDAEIEYLPCSRKFDICGYTDDLFA